MATNYNISSSELLSKYNNDETSAVADLVNRVRSGEIWFPFHRYFGKSVNELFDGIRNIDLDVVTGPYRLYSYYPEYRSYLPPKFRNKQTVIAGSKDSYTSADVMSDYYIEDVRLKAKRYDQQISILECWANEECLQTFFQKALTYDTINPETLRDSIYRTLAETKIFNPTWAKALLKLVLGPNLAGKKWLDISAGWGDRLITAMAMDMDYLGFDPNLELQSGHSQMIADFGDPMRHKVVYEPFESAAIPDDFVADVVLSSTPYFNLEEYAPGQAGQSIVSYPEFNQWMVWFLFESLRKAWSHLKVGGYLILHLGDANTIRTAEATNIFIENNLPGASWEGVLGLKGEAGYPRPVWIWKKVGPTEQRVLWEPDAKNKFALPSHQRTLMNTYPELQHELIRYYADKYSKDYLKRYNAVKSIRSKVAEMVPDIPKENIDILLSDAVLISSLLETLQIPDVVNWAVEVVKTQKIDSNFVATYAPYYFQRKENGVNIIEHVALSLPNVPKDDVRKVLQDDLMISSLLEVLGAEGTIKWGIAMVQLSYR